MSGFPFYTRCVTDLPERGKSQADFSITRLSHAILVV
jgi:hypothetical protein